MPITPTYPGEYIEEIPSGVRPITGVPTSITAFIGRTLRGPVENPVTINSFRDFERVFGGLGDFERKPGKALESSTLAYAVRDFYINGGKQAIIVRLHKGATKAKLNLLDEDSKNLILQAANEGAWGNNLRSRVDHDVKKEVADHYGVSQTDLFNLTVRDTKTGLTEEFRNITVVDSPRKIDKVLEGESDLVRATEVPPKMPKKHGGPDPGKAAREDDKSSTKVADADKGSDGDPLTKQEFTGAGLEAARKGLFALDKADVFNLLCIPPHTLSEDIEPELVGAAGQYCEKRRAILLVDPPVSWKKKEDAKENMGKVGTNSKNAALFFPRLKQLNPLRDNQLGDFAPCGAVAGVIARTDAQRGVWKAPAGLEATLVGVPELGVSLTDAEIGELNALGVNCLRAMPAVGRVVWGSRTLQGDDRLASEWKYIPVRRLALFMEESIFRGTRWVVFEPNDEPLWAQIRLNLGAFMHNLFRQGAFQGTTLREAYFVKCDKETTTQNDINLGIVNIAVGFAPLKPAKFVIINIQQMAGQIET